MVTLNMAVEKGIANAAVAAVIQQEQGQITFQSPEHGYVSLSYEGAVCSNLLSDLLHSSDTDAQVVVPVDWTALKLWLAHIHERSPIRKKRKNESLSGVDTAVHPDVPPPGSSPVPEASIRQSPTSGIHECCQLIQAADVLIDEDTKQHCAQAIAHSLFQQDAPSRDDVEQAVRGLPEHLQNVVLSQHPLSKCFSSLPCAWHTLALYAHHPSISATSSLHLSHLPIPSLLPALVATSSLTHLLHLSLAGATFPHACAPCMEVITALPALSWLDVRDTGLRAPTAAALAEALPCMRNLRHLRLSRNRFVRPVMHALAPALRRCARLEALDLMDTLCLDPGEAQGLEVLVPVISMLTCLTFLALGRYDGRYDSGAASVCPSAQPHCTALLHSACSLPALRELHLSLFGEPVLDGPAVSPVLVEELSRLSELNSLCMTLCMTLPMALPAGVSTDVQKSARTPASVCFSSALTSLALDIVPDAPSSSQSVSCESYVPGVFPDLSCMPLLQSLELWVPLPRDHSVAAAPCTTLAAALPCMPHLTQLRLHGPALRQRAASLQDTSAASLLVLLEAVMRSPSVKVLHVPVSATRCRVHKALSCTLLQAAKSLNLSIDMNIDRSWSVAQDPRARKPGTREHVPTEEFDFVPLFPCVVMLDLRFPARVVGHDPMTPVADALASLSQLRELHVHARGVQLAKSPVSDVLNGISCLSGLTRLVCDVYTRMCVVDRSEFPLGGREQQFHGLGEFLVGLRALVQLKDLTFDLESMAPEFQEELLRACLHLPVLEVLDLGCFSDWDAPVCEEVLPQLMLKELHVSVEAIGFEALSAHLGQMQYLRVLATHSYGAERLAAADAERIRAAVADLPGFQVLCDQ